ncbi:MAG TPA: hypothetical protein DIT15_16050 [Arthrobacter bacterium]|nr:hypothetical protein [Arthrobacter sp.]
MAGGTKDHRILTLRLSRLDLRLCRMVDKGMISVNPLIDVDGQEDRQATGAALAACSPCAGAVVGDPSDADAAEAVMQVTAGAEVGAGLRTQA